jgi:mono/diheme cytochrome c family protein
MHSITKALLAGTALAYTQAGYAADPATPARDPTYAKVCSHCHDTGVGPALLSRQLQPQYVENTVRHGFRAMPAFRPSEIDAKALADVARWVSESPVAKR